MMNHEINGTGAISIPNFIDAINSEGNGAVFGDILDSGGMLLSLTM